MKKKTKDSNPIPAWIKWAPLRMVADNVGINYRTLLGWVQTGRVPAQKRYGTRWHIPREFIPRIQNGDLYPAIGKPRKPE